MLEMKQNILPLKYDQTTIEFSTTMLQMKQTQTATALARALVTYVSCTRSQAMMTSMSLLFISNLSQAHAATPSQSTQAADERVEEQRLWNEEVNKYRHKEDKHVYQRFANPNKYRDGIVVNSAQDLIEYSIEELNKKELFIPDFMKLY